MKLLALLLLIPALSFAQKKVEKQDTISVELKEPELAILNEYEREHTQLQQQMQQQVQLMQNELKRIQDNYRRALKILVEGKGGDSKKWFDMKDKKIYYLK